MMLRILCFAMGLACAALDAGAQSQTLEPTVPSATSFAIVIDSATYARIASSVSDYRTAVEQSGLGTYVLVDAWREPEVLRERLHALHDGPRKLEGAVLIGAIPVPMILDAQHLTSAYRRDQDALPRRRAAVASDRFFEDFDLAFDSLGADPEAPSLHYFSLRGDGAQRVEKELYTARIFAPASSASSDETAARAIATFLSRATEAKRAPRRLLNAITVAGTGYHSESIDAWSASTQLLREAAPQLFRPGGHVWTYHYSQGDALKGLVLRQLADPALDLAIFHVHENDDAQILCPEPRPRTGAERVDSLRAWLRGKLRRAKERGEDPDVARGELERELGVPQSWFDGAFDADCIARDAAAERGRQIAAEDLARGPIGARLLVLDECFAGRFSEPSCLAAQYVFGAGGALAAVANTVNVLQDVWADENLGLLGYGVSVGRWHLRCPYLESQLFGDPTFAFDPPGGRGLVELERRIDTAEVDELKSLFVNGPIAPVRDLALGVLARRKGAEVAPELQQTLLSDASDTLRLRALSGLARIGGEKLETQLAAAAHDPSEMVRRKAVTLIGEVASESLLPVLWEVLATDPSPRVAYDAANALEAFGRERAEASLRTWLATPSARRSSELEASLRTRLPAARGAEGGSLADDLAALSARDLDAGARMDAIRAFRHVHAPAAIEPLLALAKDDARDAKLRRAAIEALGWFVYSRERASIETASEQLAATASAPQSVRDEATKTVRRLRAGANHPLTP